MAARARLVAASAACAMAAALLFVRRRRSPSVKGSSEPVAASSESDAGESDDDTPPRPPVLQPQRLEFVDLGGGSLAPVDYAAAEKWLGNTQMEQLLDGSDDEGWRDALVRRIKWNCFEEDETVAESLAGLDTLVVVVEGELAVVDAAHKLPTPLSSEVGLCIDDEDDDATPTFAHQPADDSRRRPHHHHHHHLKRIATVGPFEALGKYSVVVVAAEQTRAARAPLSPGRSRSAKHRIVATVSGTIVASLPAADLRELCAEEPAALLNYARRCVARLHRVARFANSELAARRDDDEAQDATSLAAYLSDEDVALVDAYALPLECGDVVRRCPRGRSGLGGCVVLTHGAVRCGATRVEAPAVLHGFSWLDDTQLVCASDESSWPNESDIFGHFIVCDGPARMAILDDSEEEGVDLQHPSDVVSVVQGASEDCRRRSVVAGVILAVCAAMEPDVRAFSDSGMSRRLVQAGAVLLKAGDAAPGFFYVVISGRVRCTEPRRDSGNGSWRTWRSHREVVRGGTVGLSAALSGAAQLREDAICVRDTELVAVPNPVLLDGAGEDQGRNGVWLRQLRASLLSEEEEHREEVSTIAVFGVDAAGAAAASHLAPRLAHALRTVVDEGHVLRVRRKDFLRKKNEPATTRRRRVSAWIAEREETHRFIVLECDDEASSKGRVDAEDREDVAEWSQIALSQADAVVIVAHASKSTAFEPSAMERDALWGPHAGTGRERRRLVVLAHDTTSPRHGAAAWLEKRPSKRRPRLAHYRLDDGDAADAEPALGVRKNCGALFYASRLRDLQHEAKMERYDADADARRLARLIAGRAVGVVLGGGGSRGLAHLGVLASLESHGVEIDMLGGCSQGAYMGAAYAAPSDSAVRCRAVRKAAGKLARALTSPLSILADLTIPVLSFFHGARFTAAVRRSLHLAFEYEEPAAGPDIQRGDSASWHAASQTDGRRRARSFAGAARLTENSVVTIEDAWLTYFCVSTNLSNQSCAVHDAGPLARWVRASMSVAEYLPPVRDPKTNMLHADGCYVNNLPVDIMKRDFGAHVVIGVSVVDTSGSEFDGVVAYGEDGVSGLWLLLCRFLNAIGLSHNARTVPTMGDIRDVLQILRNRTQLREARRDGLVDLFLEIEPVKNSSAATYWRLEHVAALARDYADPLVEDWLALRDASASRRSAAALRGRGDGASSRLALPVLRSVLGLSRAGLFDSQATSETSADSLRSAPYAPHRRSGRASFFSGHVY